MKTFMIVLAIVACSLLVSGCVFIKIKDTGSLTKESVKGNGIITEKTFEVGDFSRVELSVPADVTYTLSDTPSVLVRVDENLMEKITVSEENGLLTVKPTEKSFRNFKKLEIRLSSSSLASLQCDGAVDFNCAGPVRSETFSLECNGAADVEMENLDAKTVSFVVNGAGDIDVSLADADQVSLKISGAGDANLSGKTREVQVEVNGAGDVDLSRLDYENLVKKVNGMGSVKTAKSRI